jgi:hypothetical protein
MVFQYAPDGVGDDDEDDQGDEDDDDFGDGLEIPEELGLGLGANRGDEKEGEREEDRDTKGSSPPPASSDLTSAGLTLRNLTGSLGGKATRQMADESVRHAKPKDHHTKEDHEDQRGLPTVLLTTRSHARTLRLTHSDCCCD